MGEMYDRIKAASKAKGLTITAVEKQLEFARGSLSKIDDHKPSAEKAALLSALLDIPIEDLTAPKKKKITAVFHKKNSAQRGSDRPERVNPADLISPSPQRFIPFDSEKIARSISNIINEALKEENVGFSVDVSKYETPQEEVALLEHYRAADPGTRAAVRKLLDIPEEEIDDLLPVAAHARDGATLEEQMEDAELLHNKKGDDD